MTEQSLNPYGPYPDHAPITDDEAIAWLRQSLAYSPAGMTLVALDLYKLYRQPDYMGLDPAHALRETLLDCISPESRARLERREDKEL